MKLSVIIPAHNPHAGRLRRTLAGLRGQTLPAADWECLLVDNASTPAIDASAFADTVPAGLRVVREPVPGLTHARSRGFTEARGEFAVLVDEDNVIDSGYLAAVLDLFTANPHVGVLGGKSLPEFEIPPPRWAEQFFGLLALRDLGETPLISTGLCPAGVVHNEYPAFAPIGAGMAIRRAAWEAWLHSPTRAHFTDRCGDELTSGGDNDIVLCAMASAWEVGYFPELTLTHLIPDRRLQPAYLARLNRGIAKSWVQVLHRHNANPWPAILPWTVPLRQLKAWFSYRAWAGSAAYIRWQGACGHFEGRSLLEP
ncbi:MAG TPA: glycosyltransferase [Opitutaceae bacterium]|nr:glycosyltransferase [Opitutaceae bacterium]HRJ45753.1 glycosyltransferase [Opitutaceae bacterium]